MNWNWMVRVVIAAAIVASNFDVSAETHELKLGLSSVHWGGLDEHTKPVLRIASGDTVTVETMLLQGGNGLDHLRQMTDLKESEIPHSVKEMETYAKEHKLGGPQTGPIYVEGAEPGDVLEVKILNFEFLHLFGWQQFKPDKGTLPDEFPYYRVKLLRFDLQSGTATFNPGIALKLAPFWGAISVAYDRQGGDSPRGPHYDNKELVAGSTLYLPVQVRGALVQFGDGHALQGDGEIARSALETSLRGTVQLSVRKGKRLLWPRAESPTHFITMGFHSDLDEAARLAVREMIDYLSTEKGLSREDAYLLCSLAVDLHVTQIVGDDKKGVHAMVPKSIFK